MSTMTPSPLPPSTVAPPPVVVTGRLDEDLSRWLWLVKWLLVLPHYLVLAVLWPVFLVTTAMAGVAILVTGRYPRGLFELNAGILRWTWRVSYYAYAALGTDRYPPFALADVPDYPARLQIDYPQQLSRGLVLVKWWLLVLPHYLVVGLLVGGGWWAFGSAGDDARVGGPGLIGVLVLVAGVILAFSGRYPRPLFDLVVGLDRWVLRVAAYAGLMTDAYPPFRLDTGGPEPGSGVLDVPGRPAGGPPPDPVGRSSAGGTAAVVLGALLLLPALGLLGGGGAALWADQTQRDSAGFLTSGTTTLSSSTAVLVTEPLDLQLHGPDDLYIEGLLGEVRVRVTSTGDEPVFLGIGRSADVARYLAGVEHDVVTDVRDGDASYTRRPGTTPAVPPAGQPFWWASSTGTGTVEEVVEPTDGRWTAVVMSADAAPGVAVEADVGAEAPVLAWVGWALLLAGGLLLLGAVVLLTVGARWLSRPRTTPTGWGTPPGWGTATG